MFDDDNDSPSVAQNKAICSSFKIGFKRFPAICAFCWFIWNEYYEKKNIQLYYKCFF